MASTTYTDQYSNGTTKTTVKYSANTSGMGYTILSDSLKDDFNFLTGDLSSVLKEMRDVLKEAGGMTEAFYFENGGSVGDIAKSCDEVNNDIDQLLTSLVTLENALKKDIDNINDELSHNYGWPIGVNYKETSRHTEEIPKE